jgi:hypothetical protein
MVPSWAVFHISADFLAGGSTLFDATLPRAVPHLHASEGTCYVPAACDVDDKPRLLARPEETSMEVTVAPSVKRSLFTTVICLSRSRMLQVRTPMMS